jgi:N-hydroxyarylamine O-acetyltransferase
VDVQPYLRRIGYAGDLHPTYRVFEALHLAHATHIPFENLDILMGRSIRIDVPAIHAKLVEGRRGGYCFEQNLLFAAVLEEIGFRVTRLAARVRYTAQQMLPRTHMLLLVEADGSNWVADVGFGAKGLLLPVSFSSGVVSKQFLWSYRVVAEGALWVLQYLQEGAWVDLYAFTLEPQHQIDYEMANYFTSTHPTSRFVLNLTAQSTLTTVRTVLRNRDLIVDKGDAITKRVLADDDEILEVLGSTFGLHFPAGTRFNYSR